MQPGVSSYSFQALIDTGELDLFGVIEQSAALGFSGIEFAGLNLAPGETATGIAPRLREASAAAGLPVINYAIGADFLQPGGGDYAAEVARVKGEVRVAALLGAPCMRHDVSRGFPKTRQGAQDFDAALPVLVAACREITAYAADQGIMTLVENHGFFFQESRIVEALICRVDHPNFGLLLDIGNFLCVDEDPLEGVGRLAPYARHVHVKDFHRKAAGARWPGEGWFYSRGGCGLRGAIAGHGDVPVAACLGLLRRAGYDQTMSIEFEGLEDPVKGLRLGQSVYRSAVKGVDKMGASRVLGLIPARYGSTRLPGKALAMIAGKPMVQRVYEQALGAQTLDAVYVATDDARIVEAVAAFGGKAVMTAPDHPSGTDRLAEAIEHLEGDIIVNIQGDQPFVDPVMIDEGVQPLLADPALEMATLMHPIHEAADLADPSVVKTVVDLAGNALYFSRALIPFPQKGAARRVFEHIGLYVYRRAFLLQLAQWAPTPLEEIESLEQLRVIEHGHRLRVIETRCRDNAFSGFSVDTAEDVTRAEAMLRERGLS